MSNIAAPVDPRATMALDPSKKRKKKKCNKKKKAVAGGSVPENVRLNANRQSNLEASRLTSDTGNSAKKGSGVSQVLSSAEVMDQLAAGNFAPHSSVKHGSGRRPIFGQSTIVTTSGSGSPERVAGRIKETISGSPPMCKQSDQGVIQGSSKLMSHTELAKMQQSQGSFKDSLESLRNIEIPTLEYARLKRASDKRGRADSIKFIRQRIATRESGEPSITTPLGSVSVEVNPLEQIMHGAEAPLASPRRCVPHPLTCSMSSMKETSGTGDSDSDPYSPPYDITTRFPSLEKPLTSLGVDLDLISQQDEDIPTPPAGVVMNKANSSESYSVQAKVQQADDLDHTKELILNPQAETFVPPAIMDKNPVEGHSRDINPNPEKEDDDDGSWSTVTRSSKSQKRKADKKIEETSTLATRQKHVRPPSSHRRQQSKQTQQPSPRTPKVEDDVINHKENYDVDFPALPPGKTAPSDNPETSVSPNITPDSGIIDKVDDNSTEPQEVTPSLKTADIEDSVIDHQNPTEEANDNMNASENKAASDGFNANASEQDAELRSEPNESVSFDDDDNVTLVAKRTNEEAETQSEIEEGGARNKPDIVEGSEGNEQDADSSSEDGSQDSGPLEDPRHQLKHLPVVGMDFNVFLENAPPVPRDAIDEMRVVRVPPLGTYSILYPGIRLGSSYIASADVLPSHLQKLKAKGYQVFDLTYVAHICETCGKELSDRDETIVVCPGCGPNSAVRYCSKHHLYKNMQWHWPSCGFHPIRAPVNFRTLPERYASQIPAILECNGKGSVQRVRQLMFSILEHDMGDYALYDDIRKSIRQYHGRPCPAGIEPKAVLKFKGHEKDRVNRALNICFYNHKIKQFPSYLFRLFRVYLKENKYWNKEIETELIYQFQYEFNFTALHSPDIMQNEDEGRRAVEELWTGRSGLKATADLLEKECAELRAWRREHPDVKDPWARIRGDGYPELNGNGAILWGNEGFVGWGGMRRHWS